LPTGENDLTSSLHLVDGHQGTDPWRRPRSVSTTKTRVRISLIVVLVVVAVVTVVLFATGHLPPHRRGYCGCEIGVPLTRSPSR
jgi:hypothetical protein